MGKKLDALFRRNPKPPKLKTLANLAIARLAILKNQRQVRCSHARSDVVQLLNLGHQDSALLRVEHVIREQNMLDVFVVIENYCHLLIEGFLLIENNRECPEELEEAISSLIFAASRCGELPELQEIRGIFTSRYGKEFVSCAVELRNNCRVNLKIIQKLSVRQASLETRQKLVKKIASDNGITHRYEDDDYAAAEEKQEINQKEDQLKPNEGSKLNGPEVCVDVYDFPEARTQDERFSESMKARKKYKDVAAAARDAFESAAYAAAAARAAVELSRSESQDLYPEDHDGSNHKQESAFISGGSSRSKLGVDEDIKPSDKRLGFDKIHPIDNFCSESEDEDTAQNSKRGHLKDLESSNKKAGLGRTLSSSSSDTDNDNQYGGEETSNLDHTAPLGEQIVFDESDDDIDETNKNRDSIQWLKHHHSGSNKNSHIPIKYQKTTTNNAVADESVSETKGYKPHGKPLTWKSRNPQADFMTRSVDRRSRLANTRYMNAEKHLYSQHSTPDRRPISTIRRRE